MPKWKYVHLLTCAFLSVGLFSSDYAYASQTNHGEGNTHLMIAQKSSDQIPTLKDQIEGSAADEIDDTDFDDEFDFPEEQEAVYPVQIADPLEPYNRVMFQINDKLYFWLLKPMAQGYNFVVAEDFRTCIANFFSNVLTPLRLVNCMLQGKFKNAETEVLRFVVNSSIGILGFGDPGKQMFNMDISNEDFGQTLGLWGFGHGFYIVWPLVASSSLRESVGFAVDLWANPIAYLQTSGATLGVGLYRRFNDLSLRIGEYEAIKEAALEPYSAVRNGYIQFRNTLVEK